MSLSTGILVGLVLGIGCGIFFGESMSFLSVVAEAFIRLLQMAVIPFVTVSLVMGLGRISRAQGRFLARQGALLMLLFWGIALSLVLLMPFAFPDWKTASFFSTTLVEPAAEFDFISLYIPANPFHSMANDVVPAVVLFSIVLGVGLMRVEGRETLISNLEVLAKALTRVTNFVVSLTPIGVFAIAANAAGTMTVDDFGRLQVYVLTFAALSLIATFWIVPGLVPVLTPLRYRDVIRASRDALITAFSTGSLFVVLPLLVERAKELLHEAEPDGDDASSVVDVLVPVSFNFPNMGKLLTLGFVLFAAWFTGTRLSPADYPVLLGSGLLTFFGSVNVALPFLLDLLRIPADMFQLFVAVGFINFRFATLVGVMHTMVLALLAYYAVGRRMRLNWTALLRYLVISAGLIVAVLSSGRLFFSATVESAYQQYELITARTLVTEPIPTVVHRTEPAVPSAPESDGPVLDRIVERGVLRVGYVGLLLPYNYFNDAGDLVGHDIDLLHRLARDLGVTLEFIPMDLRRLREQLESGLFDMTTSVAVTPNRSRQVGFATHSDFTLSLVVRDFRREAFATVASIREMKGLRIAVPRVRYYQKMLERWFPEAEVILIDSEREFFDAEPGEIDAMLHAAEVGAAWTLLYPDYSVVVPEPIHVKAPLGFVFARGELEFGRFLESWLDLNRKNGGLEALYRYWILGRDDAAHQPRWSVIRDVLHWVE